MFIGYFRDNALRHCIAPWHHAPYDRSQEHVIKKMSFMCTSFAVPAVGVWDFFRRALTCARARRRIRIPRTTACRPSVPRSPDSTGPQRSIGGGGTRSGGKGKEGDFILAFRDSDNDIHYV